MKPPTKLTRRSREARLAALIRLAKTGKPAAQSGNKSAA
jgi:hypothetical protein